MNVLSIGICDDEIIIQKILADKIKQCLEKKELNAKIYMFEAGADLLRQAFKLDVIFLDIQMPEMNGIEVGRKLKKINGDCKVIIVTSKENYYKEAFRIGAFRFITKPFEIHEIEEALEAVNVDKAGIDIIKLYDKRMVFEIEQREINYIVAYDSYANFILGNRVFRKNVSLNELETVLDKRIFFRINRKVIVNMLWIQEYKKGEIVINTEKMIVSRRKRKEFELAFIEYDIMHR
ncbi:MAG: response regulator transcription factor [Candidatus Galacturonibacter soehngenii]|nr:response regulator transcription factor [Candidatus Galacturonibacter soehngenii]